MHGRPEATKRRSIWRDLCPGPPTGHGEGPVACFGEIGLTGELRYVAHAERRMEEAARFGLERLLLPSACIEGDGLGAGLASSVRACSTLSTALSTVLGSASEVPGEAADAGRRAA